MAYEASANPSTCARRRADKQPAQAMVEAALMFPLMVLLLVGIVDFGRVFYHHIGLANAVREGARVGINSAATDTQITAAVVAAGAPTSSSAQFSCCIIAPSGARAALTGQQITVTVSYAMPLITPGMSQLLSPVLDGNGRLPLSQTVRMVII